MTCALDLVSGVTEALGASMESLVAASPLVDLLMQCCQVGWVALCGFGWHWVALCGGLSSYPQHMLGDHFQQTLATYSTHLEMQPLSTRFTPLSAPSSTVQKGTCPQDTSADVRQSAFALVGDLAKSCPARLGPRFKEVVGLTLHALDPRCAVVLTSLCCMGSCGFVWVCVGSRGFVWVLHAWGAAWSSSNQCVESS